MKMNVSQWANHNNMTPEEFKNEMAATMAAIGGMELDSNNDEKMTAVAFNVEDRNYRYKVIVSRKAL
jgi:hypothetical protein